MIKQLREFYSPDELSHVYQKPYDSGYWADHRERIAMSAAIVSLYAVQVDALTVADLSCGDGRLIDLTTCNFYRRVLGDYVSAPHLDVHGPVEETIKLIDPVGMFILSETLEHVEDPAALLADIRTKTKHLFLSTPYDEVTDDNPQHYWGWDAIGIHNLLTGAGFFTQSSTLWTPTTVPHYTFQLWLAS